MATPNNPQQNEATKKCISSPPKPEEITYIPRIILDERRQTSLSLPSSLETSLYSGNLPKPEWGDNIYDAIDKENGRCDLDTSSGSQETSSHKPKRSSSDIGLPTGSTSYLKNVDGTNTSENYLGVFCSPRTVRRSVDSGISSREHALRHGEWLQNVDYSNNCLKVLTSASRVGSAISLNSEYTARSIGLLSNGSDSDKDFSLTESESHCSKPSQLRRFMSCTDDDVSHETCARPSQSLDDLNTKDNIGTDYELGSEIPNVIHDYSCSTTMQSEPVTMSISDGRPGSLCEPSSRETTAHNLDMLRNRNKDVSLSSNMMSYKYESHDATRDSRIRQWLQDMDSRH
uniref:Uncharacterized protein n=1 Tax=Arion vulgaris TaxID=1028688 RepID=A0A0B6YAI4_9EUPU